MKKLRSFFLIAILLIVYDFSQAQYVDIMPYGGYQFAAGVDVYNYSSAGRLRIKPAGNYGLDLDVVLPFHEIAITASFTNTQTNVTFQENFQAEEH